VLRGKNHIKISPLREKARGCINYVQICCYEGLDKVRVDRYSFSLGFSDFPLNPIKFGTFGAFGLLVGFHSPSKFCPSTYSLTLTKRQ
jgi:hypothetical protein